MSSGHAVEPARRARTVASGRGRGWGDRRRSGRLWTVPGRLQRFGPRAAGRLLWSSNPQGLTSHARRPRRALALRGPDHPWARPSVRLPAIGRVGSRAGVRAAGTRRRQQLKTQQEHAPVRPDSRAGTTVCGLRSHRRHHMAVVTMRQLLESGVHFGHQTRRWNPKMKRFIMTERNGIYIIDLQQSLAYIDRSYAFIKDDRRQGRHDHVRRHQEAGPGGDRRAGDPRRDALRQPALARWHAHQLPDRAPADQPPQGARRDRLRRRGRQQPHQEGAAADAPRARQAEQVARRYPRDEPDAVRGLDRRHQQGAPRRRGGAQAAHPDHRHPGLQLRPRPGRLPDPGQRRRDPRGRPADPRGRRRRRRGPDRPLRRQGRPRAPRPSAPRSRWPSGSASCWVARPRPPPSRPPVATPPPRRPRPPRRPVPRPRPPRPPRPTEAVRGSAEATVAAAEAAAEAPAEAAAETTDAQA